MNTTAENARRGLGAAYGALAPLARTLAVGALSGAVAGAIAGGIGGRVAMRISAIAAEDRFQGTLTDAEETVGEITAEGTIALIIFGGIFTGAFGGLVYLGMRRWLADAGPWRGLAFGGLLLAMFGWAVIEGDNPDFHKFGPPMLNIGMFAAIYIAFGLLLVPVLDWMERSLPRPSLSAGGLGALAAYGFALLLALAVLGFAASGGDEENQRAAFTLLPLYALLAVPALAFLIARLGGGFERLSDLRGRWPLLVAALTVLALPVALGIVLDVRAVSDIFEADF